VGAVSERNIPTGRPPLVGEVSAKFLLTEGVASARWIHWIFLPFYPFHSFITLPYFAVETVNKI
jgi:hypothetical protein